MGLCEMHWKNFGELSKHDGNKVYFSGEEDTTDMSMGLDFLCIRT